jgi:hypothetical protein
MPRKLHKYHYIYKITCNITGRYYIGMHSTSNLEDGYFGSGKRLKYSILKHGKENHSKKILEFLENRILLKNREFQLVNFDLLKDIMCMNLQPGGGGGFCNEEHARKFYLAGAIATNKIRTERLRNKISTDTTFKEKMYLNIANSHLLNNGSKNGWLGKVHTVDSKLAIGKVNSIKQSGNRNSQYNKCWIMKGTENKLIHKSDLSGYLEDDWKLGRKMPT